MDQFSSGRTAIGVHKVRPLDYQGVYTCPICRHGEVSAMTLMDAFSCNFCHHIFAANLPGQSIQVVDSSQAMVWRWNGDNWQAIHRGNLDLTWLIWFLGVILVVLPPILIGLTSYMFPSLNSQSWNFPIVWTGLTFFLHLTLVAWLIAEHHQFPAYVTAKVRLKELLGQR